MLKFRFSLSQDQIPLRKLFLPIAGTNPAEEIVLPYNRHNFRSSLSHSSGICSCDREEQLPQQNLYLLFLPITGTTSAAELAPALGLSGSCTCYRDEQFPQRSKFRCKSCTCDREEQTTAAEFAPAIGRSGSCTCYYKEEQFPQRNLFL